MAGPLAVVGACLAWGLDNNVAGATNTALALLLGTPRPAAGVLLGALVVGFPGYGVSLVLYVRAMRELGTARTGAYFSRAPFIGAAIAVVAWREPVSLSFMLAALLMGLGLWLQLTERHEHPHAHEALEHAHARRHDAHHPHPHGADDPPGEPHTHTHRHEPVTHVHPHYPDIHHRHPH